MNGVVYSWGASIKYLFQLLEVILQGKAKDIELKGHTDSVDQLCWDPKHAELIATASGDKTVRLWDARSKFMFYYLPHLGVTLRDGELVLNLFLEGYVV